MSTVFIALQCCECSTMQVKQQKKSSNKWTCVICNQKQSVRKVFARGFLPKDVRKFVQDFNMSRQIADTQLPAIIDCAEPPLRDDESGCLQKKRTHWTEYLTDQDEEKEKENEDPVSDAEIKIVTEPPAEMFRKARVRRNSLRSEPSDFKARPGGSELVTPTFAKRKGNPNLLQKQEGSESKRCNRVAAQKASKWSDYLDGDVEEGDLPRDIDTPLSRLMDEDFIVRASVIDELVEEDVHPDFL